MNDFKALYAFAKLSSSDVRGWLNILDLFCGTVTPEIAL